MRGRRSGRGLVPAWRRGGIAAVALAACLALAAVAEEAGDDGDAERRLGDIVDRLNALDTWLGDADRRIAEQQRELAAADRRIDEYARQIRELAARQRSAAAGVAEIEIERGRLEAVRDGQAERIADHVRGAWRFPRRDLLRTLLNQEDPDRFDRMVRYHGYFARARADALADYRATLEALSRNADDAARQRLSLAQAQVSADDRRRSLLEGRSARKLAIDRLQAEVEGRTAEREGLQRDRDRLEALLAAIADRSAAEPPSPQAAPELVGLDLVESRGDLPWPIEGEIVSRFGDSRAGGRMRWEGVYFSAPPGSDVTAVANGRIVFADWLRGFGLLTIIDHGGGHLSLYGHSDALYRKEGEWVSGGEAIAAAGQSGGRPDIGVYFEVRADGQPTDPMAWLR